MRIRRRINFKNNNYLSLSFLRLPSPIRLVFFLAAMFILGLGPPFFPVRAESPPQDWTVVEKVEREEAESLASVLSGGREEIPAVKDSSQPLKLTQFEHLSSPRGFPQIIYHLQPKPQGSTPSGPALTFSAGNSLLLNQSGFFLTAFHCVSDLEDESKLQAPGRDPLVLYGPRRDLVVRGRILSYSVSSDLALGKVELPQEVRVETVHVSRANIQPSQILYAKRYGNIAYIKQKLLEAILKMGWLKRTAAGGPADPPDRKADPAWSQGLDKEVCVGQTIEIKLPDGRTILGLKPGQYFLMTGSKETVAGQSGSPVFGLNGDLVGIVVQVPRVREALRGPNGRVSRLAYFTGPGRIRALIRNYLKNCL